MSWAARSLVVVFPTDPVTAAIVSPAARSTQARARAASAAATSETISAGTPGGREASTAAAPAATAWDAKSCPSA